MSAKRVDGSCRQSPCWCHDPAWDERAEPRCCPQCGCCWDEPAPPPPPDPLSCPHCGQQAGSVELPAVTSRNILRVAAPGTRLMLVLGEQEVYEMTGDDARLCCHSCMQTWDMPREIDFVIEKVPADA